MFPEQVFINCPFSSFRMYLSKWGCMSFPWTGCSFVRHVYSFYDVSPVTSEVPFDLKFCFANCHFNISSIQHSFLIPKLSNHYCVQNSCAISNQITSCQITCQLCCAVLLLEESFDFDMINWYESYILYAFHILKLSIFLMEDKEKQEPNKAKSNYHTNNQYLRLHI